MAGLQASYDDSLARLRAAQEAETAALRSQISAAEESNRKACAEASHAQSQLSGLQVGAPLSMPTSREPQLSARLSTSAHRCLVQIEITLRGCMLCCLGRAVCPRVSTDVQRSETADQAYSLPQQSRSHTCGW